MRNSQSPLLVRAIRVAVFALLAWPAMTQQTPTRYGVEILVFRGTANVPGDAAVAEVPAESTVITPVPVTTRRLGDAASRLRSAGGYRLLAHAAWTQAPAPWNSRRGVALTQLGVTGGSLIGNVILERGQYLHLGFDLRYTEGGSTWVVNEVRRVRPNERQYFDHPAIGVIAIVTPAG